MNINDTYDKAMKDHEDNNTFINLFDLGCALNIVYYKNELKFSTTGNYMDYSLKADYLNKHFKHVLNKIAYALKTNDKLLLNKTLESIRNFIHTKLAPIDMYAKKSKIMVQEFENNIYNQTSKI